MTRWPAAGVGNCRSSVTVAAPARCMAERTTISMDSRSKLPVLRRQGLLDRAQAADLNIDFDELPAEALQLSKLGDLRLRLADGRGIGQRLGDARAIDLASQAEVGAMARIVGLMPVAGGLAAPAGGGSDRSTAQVAQGGDLTGQGGAQLFEGLNSFRVRGGRPLFEHIMYARIEAPTKGT
jgi:hypothetical protein